MCALFKDSGYRFDLGSKGNQKEYHSIYLHMYRVLPPEGGLAEMDTLPEHESATNTRVGRFGLW